MTTVLLLRILAIALGMIVWIVTFVAFARKKLTAHIGLGWGVLGLLLILVGAIPGFLDWSRNLGYMTTILGCFIFVCVLFTVFGLTIVLSQQVMKNQELAMQVSLLNQENEQILRRLDLLNDSDEKTEKE